MGNVTMKWLLFLLISALLCIAAKEEIDDGLIDNEGNNLSVDSTLLPEQNLKELLPPVLQQFDIFDGSTTVVDTLLPLLGLTRTDLAIMLNVAKVGLGVVKFVEKIFSQIFDGGITSDVFSIIPDADRKMLGMFNLLTYRLKQIENGVKGTEANLRDLIHGLPHLVRWEIALDTLEQYLRPINILYHRFTYYQEHRDKVENRTLLDFAESVLSHDSDSVLSLMASIHSMVSPSSPHIPQNTEPTPLNTYDVYNKVNSAYSQNYRRRVSAMKKTDDGSHSYPTEEETTRHLSKLSLRPSVFTMLKNSLQEYSHCQLSQSEQQLIQGLYTMIAITEAQGYAMTNYAYMLLRVYNKGNYTVERQVDRQLYTHYAGNIMKEALAVMNDADTGFMKCDPKIHKEGVTFIQITELLQGYIENEVDMNHGGTCMNSCGYYDIAEVQGCYLPDQQYCGKHRRCRGTVHDCQFFDADAWVCISDDPYRRYDWVEYEDNTLLGSKGRCGKIMKVDSWWRWFAHCSYCICFCDDADSPTTERYVSLMPSTSRTSDNKVVTGVRFIKKNKVIFIQVQEGAALPQGQVDTETVRWVPVQPIDVSSDSFIDGKHYQTLSYGMRRFDLDHLKAPRYHVITGVRMRMLGSHVNPEIQVTPVNFTTGEVKYEQSYWFSSDNTPSMAKNPRKELYIRSPDIPTKTPAPSQIDSRPDMFVQFQSTSLRTDVSQLTVPYFDAQEVAPVPPSWHSEFQVYHKGRAGYGGFIGLELFSYNITGHFVEDTNI